MPCPCRCGVTRRSDSSGWTSSSCRTRPGGAGIADAFRATRGIHLDRAKLLLDAGDDPRRIWDRWQSELGVWEQTRAKYDLYTD